MGGLIDAIFGGGGNETPQVVQRDVKAEQQQAEEEAAKRANASKASLKRSRQAGAASLLATGAKGVSGEAATSSALAAGKQTLGA